MNRNRLLFAAIAFAVLAQATPFFVENKAEERLKFAGMTAMSLAFAALAWATKEDKT